MDTIEVLRVKFLWPGKMYEFVNPEGLSLKRKTKVTVRTARGGTMVGSVAIPPRIRVRRPEDKNLNPVLRIANEQDVLLEQVQDEFRRDVKLFFDTRVRSRQLSGVKLVDIEKINGGQTLVVYYSSENRRFAAKDVAVEMGQKFRMKIDMRSIGVRDAARLAGGIGKCGLSLCCSTWLPDFAQVSIRMAKDQGLSLEPDGISGQCGRLLCCLGYEHENYLAMGAGMPKVGKVVVTPIGDARVVKLDILKGMVTVRGEDGTYESFKNEDVERKFSAGASSNEASPRSSKKDSTAKRGPAPAKPRGEPISEKQSDSQTDGPTDDGR